MAAMTCSAAGNGDGFDDLIIGADGADPRGSLSGASYVVFGQSGGFDATINLSTLNGTNGFRIIGAAKGDRLGRPVSSAGDVNGDGFDDLIIGAHGADHTGSNSGSSYVLFGHAGPFDSTINVNTLDGNNGFRIDGRAAVDQTGLAASSAGDINGDGFDDIIVGARLADRNGTSSGSAYIVFGKAGGFAAVTKLSALDGTNGFRIDGKAASDIFGWSVSSAGDINGDGVDDLIVGAIGADPNGSSSGASYVVFGESGGFAPTIQLSALDGTNGFQIKGAAGGDQFGWAVSSAGDINGDGFDDLIVGAHRADSSGSESGASYVLFGQSSGFTSTIQLSALDGTSGFRLDGAAAFDFSGTAVSGGGDVNGDGFDDLIVGAWGTNSNGRDTGSSYVVFGKSASFASAISLSTLDATSGFRLDGVVPDSLSGSSVSIGGDVNGDGFDDLIIGAHKANPKGSNSGSSYVLFGRNFTGGSETQVGRDSNDILAAEQGAHADVLIGGAGIDILLSDGGSDVLRGGQGDDIVVIGDTDFSGTRRLQGGSGTDTLRLTGTELTLDLTQIPDNRITDIEEIYLAGDDLTLVLDAAEVLNISSHSNTLTVRGSGSEIQVIDENEWSGPVTVTIAGDEFYQYTNGAAILNVQTTLSSSFASLSLSTLRSARETQIDRVFESQASQPAISEPRSASTSDANRDSEEKSPAAVDRSDSSSAVSPGTAGVASPVGPAKDTGVDFTSFGSRESRRDRIQDWKQNVDADEAQRSDDSRQLQDDLQTQHLADSSTGTTQAPSSTDQQDADDRWFFSREETEKMKLTLSRPVSQEQSGYSQEGE